MALLVAAVNLIAMEAFLRWWVLRRERVALLSSGVDDPSWRLAWVLQRTSARATAYPIDEFHPTRGWALKPGLQGVSASGALVSSTSRGARGTREVVVPKPSGSKRILVFGDSFTFGEEVGDDETFAATLERLLPGVEVVNLGVHGYGHDQMLLHLRESAAAYEPDVVLLGYMQWDEPRNLLTFRDFAKPYFVLADGGRLELQGTPVPSPEQFLAEEVYRSKLLDVAEIEIRRLRMTRGSLGAEMRALSDALVVAFADSVRDLGAAPLVVYFPMTDELADPPVGPLARERELAELCFANEIPFLSLRERFKRTLLHHQRTATRYHWDATEHGAAAEEMAAFISRSGLLDGEGATPREPRDSREVRAGTSSTHASP